MSRKKSLKKKRSLQKNQSLLKSPKKPKSRSTKLLSAISKANKLMLRLMEKKKS
jgi:hypothetical protein